LSELRAFKPVTAAQKGERLPAGGFSCRSGISTKDQAEQLTGGKTDSRIRYCACGKA
jgi:hypothetical protein